MSDFGDKLKKIRKVRKITQKDLALNIQVAQSTIANYENNTRFPGSLILRQISDYLEVSVDYLLGLTDVEEIEEINENQNKYDLKNVYLDLIDMLLDGGTDKAKKVIKEISSSGVSSIQIIENIFLPILKSLGDKWEKNKINIAQEHYVTGVIGELFSYVSETKIINETKNLTALFMAPAGEEHVITLRMATEYFKVRGWNIKFIGRSIPINSLLETIKKDNSDVIVLSAITQNALNSASYLVAAIKADLKEKTPKILLGGNGVDSSNEDLIDGFADCFVRSIQELPIYIEKIENEILNRQ